MARYEFAGVKQLRRLLDAVMAVGSELSLAVTLRTIIEAATDLVDAKYGALGVLDPSGTYLAEFLTVGLSEAQEAAIGPRPEGHGILGLLIVEPKPLRLPDLTEHPDSHGFPPNHPKMTSFLGVPILLRNEVFGNLYLTDKVGGDVFTDVDEELVVALAAAAGLAIENARLHEQAAASALLDDRERIARDLHDDVIQRVFAAGLSLQSTARLSSDPQVVSRLLVTIDDLDATIRQLRAAIFELQERQVVGRSVRADLMAVCAEAERVLGFSPHTDIAGPIDTAVTTVVGGQVALALREALSNVARHARASRVDVRVVVVPGSLTLLVADDGVGIDPETVSKGNGLTNMEQRAAGLGGVCSIAPGGAGGTTVTWSVPLR